jgi:mono/diheme cytochrome c family protein
MNDQQNFDNTDLDRLHAAVKREKPDSQPGYEPAPLWVFVASMAAMILGGGYAGAFVGNGSFEQNNPFESKPVDVRGIDLSSLVQLDPFQLAMKKGAQIYANCQGCHQITGTGQPGVFPPLAGSEYVTGPEAGTERMVRIVLGGLAGPVQVKGATYNNVMPAQSQLTDAELAAVLTYVRNSWGNTGTMVTKEMVAKTRADSASHVGPWSESDLKPFAKMNCPGEIPAGPGATVPPPAAEPAKK